MTRDRNVEAVRRKLLERSERGIEKYGVTTDKAGLSRLEWLQHAQDEALDFAVYLQELMRDEHGSVATEREAIANRAREIADHYPQSSDGRNTFILLAEWIDARALADSPAPPATEAGQPEGRT